MTEASTATSFAEKLNKLKSRFIRYLIITVALLLALFAAYVWLTLNWSYADGERAGYLQKLSKKGWICKTWEGELSLVALPGAAPEKFYFTIRDEAVAQRIHAAVGQRVDLHYGQHRGIVNSCFGETEYFVDDVKIIGP